MRGKFITFEGIDGAGKSTHIKNVVASLQNQGKTVIATREPGGTPLGEALRHLLLSEHMDIKTEALLMFAARQEHLAQLIEPELSKGNWVVSDRFTDATFAYQGGGRGLPWDKLRQLEMWVQDEFQPDLTFLFDLTPQTAQIRLAGTGNTPDRFENEQTDFFCRVREAYLVRAKEFPNRFRVVNTSKTVDEIKNFLEKELISAF